MLPHGLNQGSFPIRKVYISCSHFLSTKSYKSQIHRLSWLQKAPLTKLHSSRVLTVHTTPLVQEFMEGFLCFATYERIHNTTFKMTWNILACNRWMVNTQTRQHSCGIPSVLGAKSMSVEKKKGWIKFQPWGPVCPHFVPPKLLSENTGKRILWAAPGMVTRYTKDYNGAYAAFV